MNTVVMQTDFGAVPSPMVGVCKLVDPQLRVFPIAHDVPLFNIRKAGENLAEVIPYWPSGTVFVSVVDPGVGTSRRASVARTRSGHYIVTPDNGCLDKVDQRIGVDAIREIDQTVNRYHGSEWSEKSDIFHGRDVFAYCAAKLAAGIITFEEVGEEYPVSQMERIG